MRVATTAVQLTGMLAAFITSIILSACGGGDQASGSAFRSTRLASVKQAPPYYPFGWRGDAPYPSGSKVGKSQAEMNAKLAQLYDYWRNPPPEWDGAPNRRGPAIVDVQLTNDQGQVVTGKVVNNAWAGNTSTYSEAIGYGMLLTVIMAGHDPDAQAAFDGLLTTARTRHARSNCMPDSLNGVTLVDTDGTPLRNYLMEWKLADGGAPAGDGCSAADGDLDIAMALLMADKQWGTNNTTWNYRQEALNTIKALQAWNMNPADGTVRSKAVGRPDPSRTSDYMPGHFRAFAAATSGADAELWGITAVNRSGLWSQRRSTTSPLPWVWCPIG